MQRFDTANDSRESIDKALDFRAAAQSAEIEAAVRSILDSVKTHGDEAVLRCTRMYDWPDAPQGGLEVSRSLLTDARQRLEPRQLQMLTDAAGNIRRFHEAERALLQSWTREPAPGTRVGQLIQPVQKVGVYVPGGLAAYPSTVLMSAIPARIAGVREIILCTPADRSGKIHPLVAAAAAEHADRVFAIGGAQAIGALAYGTETVPAVDVIVGPGNAYVNAAKRQVYGQVGIDMLAGPSEVAIIADDSAVPAWAAADLLSQTEHGPENRGVLLSPSADLLDAVAAELDRQRRDLSRKDILAHTAMHLVFIKTRSLTEAFDLSNRLGPEHLEVMTREPAEHLSLVKNAGAVLLGSYTSAPIGDYWAGPSHTLPTAGAARFSSPLSTATFLKRTSVIEYSRDAAAQAADPVGRFADAEGFDAHAAAARMRAADAPLLADGSAT